MPYIPVTYNTGAAPGIDGPALNTIETQYTESTLSFNPDAYPAGFVVGSASLVATKDVATPNQLDVTAGKAYVLQSDGTTRQRTPSSSTQTTSALTSTYHLYLQPDGSWYWNTANSPATGSLHIADVTTDGSGNIASVTDKRVLMTPGNLGIGPGNLAALPIQIIVVGPDSTHLPAAGVKGRIAIVVPFSLP